MILKSSENIVYIVLHFHLQKENGYAGKRTVEKILAVFFMTKGAYHQQKIGGKLKLFMSELIRNPLLFCKVLHSQKEICLE